ncbi:MAG: Tn3 family transposase, partial [Oligoflexia bacterium]|nr:Tn3 family transposase [Oligoflexia bacterium]
IKKMAFACIDKNKFPEIAKYLSDYECDKKECSWQYYEKNAGIIKQHLRPLLLNIEFKSTNADDSLIKAISFLKENILLKQPIAKVDIDKFPISFIPKEHIKYIVKKSKSESTINPIRYESLIYRLLRNNIESGKMYCEVSASFNSLEADLISDERWMYKKKILESINSPNINIPIKRRLMLLKSELEHKINDVDKRIESGENSEIKIKKNEEKIEWSLPYTKKIVTDKSNLFDNLEQINISDLLVFVDTQTSFLKSFTHTISKNIKNNYDKDVIMACMIAYGTNLGIYKMAQISNIALSNLCSISNSYIREESLRMANDIISNKISELAIFKYFNLEDNIIFSSSDGQKHETSINTIRSRHSPKYFGLRKGISSYTLLANHIPINAKIIGANEHESHHVFDILFNNSSTVRPLWHTTDNHGINNVNFALLDFFGYRFAPRYKKINNKERLISGFKSPKDYKNFLINPTKKINEKIIIEEWDNIQRIIASLSLKTTTQSIITKKLSSFKRKNKTRVALWEYDNIFKSIHILNYIDDVLLRQNIQMALNRGESYHQLKRSIAFANSGKLRVKTDVEQNIWSECARLIANCIIYYNSYILSDLLTKNTDQEKVELIIKSSPVAWKHINLYGRYEFNKNIDVIFINQKIAEISNLLAI